ncbi:hypothetical protein HK105_205857 [Polyrhizophydium stewartii]|uniref:Uncharacterized protein n=1 Tax=Polyrhizophydium stewartii TaxID=2732419 RepID=A0ABR4N5C2_9FUNG
MLGQLDLRGARLVVAVALALVFVGAVLLHTMSPSRPPPPAVYAPIIKAQAEPGAQIPLIIHQAWPSAKLPPNTEAVHNSWRDMHTFWEHKLWSDEDSLKLYGGFYADLDVECLKNHIPFVRWGGAIVSSLASGTSGDISVPNAWLASVPGHPLWLFLLKRAFSGEKNSAASISDPNSLRDGIGIFLQTVKDDDAAAQVHVLEPGVVFPYDWRAPSSQVAAVCSPHKPTFSRAVCKRTVDPKHGAFAVSYRVPPFVLENEGVAYDFRNVLNGAADLPIKVTSDHLY